METKANYTLVGAFVVFLLISLIVFVMWIAKIGFSQHKTEYDIYFEGGVTGLKEGSTVLYRGVPIGSVKEINLDAAHVEKIHVLITVGEDVPIQEDAFASLELQGITGASYIQLKGGTTNANPLLPKPGQKRAVIPARSSILEEVTSSLPIILHNVSKTFEDIRSLFTDDARQVFEETLKHIHTITKSLSTGEEGDVGEMIRSIKEGIIEARSVAHDIKDLLKENRGNISDFTETGLPALTQFLLEGKDTLEVIRRVTEALERSPGRFLYNDPTQGVKVP